MRNRAPLDMGSGLGERSQLGDSRANYWSVYRSAGERSHRSGVYLRRVADSALRRQIEHYDDAAVAIRPKCPK